ncbi:MAG: hypothetical protein AB1571_00510 [Nanoarchaeota archaeon]
MQYDAVIVGGSFAGLAVASEVSGRVLLIDRKKIGGNVTSACGTRYDLAREISKKSILQKFNTVTLNTKNNEHEVKLNYPYCTIDYETFCKDWMKKIDAEFIKTNAVGYKNGKGVITKNGNYDAKCIVDCSGWNAVIASSLRKNFVNKKMMSFGIETELKYKDNTLRFFADSGIIKKGAAWIFPIGNESRFGVASYVGRTKILDNLKNFVKRYKLRPKKVYGGYFPYGLRDCVAGNIFLVGDSACQTIPLTGEGIRIAVNYGRECGKIVQKVIDNEITLEQGLNMYGEIGNKNKRYYELILKAQNMFINMSDVTIERFAKLLDNKMLMKIMEEKYQGL